MLGYWLMGWDLCTVHKDFLMHHNRTLHRSVTRRFDLLLFFFENTFHSFNRFFFVVEGIHSISCNNTNYTMCRTLPTIGVKYKILQNQTDKNSKASDLLMTYTSMESR